MNFFELFTWGWLQTVMLLVSASWVARVAGMNHWLWFFFFFSDSNQVLLAPERQWFLGTLEYCGDILGPPLILGNMSQLAQGFSAQCFLPPDHAARRAVSHQGEEARWGRQRRRTTQERDRLLLLYSLFSVSCFRFPVSLSTVWGGNEYITFPLRWWKVTAFVLVEEFPCILWPCWAPVVWSWGLPEPPKWPLPSPPFLILCSLSPTLVLRLHEEWGVHCWPHSPSLEGCLLLSPSALPCRPGPSVRGTGASTCGTSVPPCLGHPSLVL
jgi:hypothetical protein